jgi:hypothetical protein
MALFCRSTGPGDAEQLQKEAIRLALWLCRWLILSAQIQDRLSRSLVLRSIYRTTAHEQFGDKHTGLKPQRRSETHGVPVPRRDSTCSGQGLRSNLFCPTSSMSFWDSQGRGHGKPLLYCCLQDAEWRLTDDAEQREKRWQWRRQWRRTPAVLKETIYRLTASIMYRSVSW